MNETAQDCCALNDAPVVFDIATCRDLVDERGDIPWPAYLFQFVLARKFITDRNEVSRLVHLVELEDSLIDCAMSVTVKVLWHKKICHLDDRLGIDNDTTEDTALGLYILW